MKNKLQSAKKTGLGEKIDVMWEIEPNKKLLYFP